jgi:hypothetical protein
MSRITDAVVDCVRPGGCEAATACRNECSWSTYTRATRNWVYYRLKPYLSRRLRTRLLRLLALHTFHRPSEKWPIDPRARRVPDDWPGWPDGRRFAVVLTHDVEGAIGVERCLQLAALEERLGFRSSFNFVPEGEYRVDRELRDQLTGRGFEVGVHDLQHDGRLFDSARAFPAKARRINRYLHEWGAVGFRSGFMFRNLDWIQDLKIAYDASTFDTDPFQPDPRGAGTIFPFYVNGTEGRRGFVELPYTLVQDSSLFLVLGQKTIDVWTRKTDWIIEHGGMVLLNVHPDYMWFGDGEAQPGTFPAKYYADFLAYLQARNAGSFWAPLPKELASWYAAVRVTRPYRRPAPAASDRHSAF